jgi:hypothetical protein
MDTMCSLEAPHVALGDPQQTGSLADRDGAGAEELENGQATLLARGGDSVLHGDTVARTPLLTESLDS